MERTIGTVSVRVSGRPEDVDGFVSRLREAPRVGVPQESGDYANRGDSGVRRYLTVELRGERGDG